MKLMMMVMVMVKKKMWKRKSEAIRVRRVIGRMTWQKRRWKKRMR
jgi:hypothetical protein